MQKDFHYYCIGLIALAAGYPPEQAQTIAYASQFVDDETIDTPIRIPGEESFFEPIRTAYRGIQFVLACLPDSQQEVLVPFHFIPKARFTEGSFTYVTKSGSGFAKSIVEEALRSGTDNRLHRIGIALHTFADTWAHHGFSGIRDNVINEVDNLKTKGRYGIQLLRLLADVANINIGHISALSVPDYPYEHWRRDNDDPHANQEGFYSASKTIFYCLLDDRYADGALKKELKKRWENKISGRISKLLSTEEPDEEIRCGKWREEIEGLQYLFPEDISSLLDYDKTLWRNTALSVTVSSRNRALGVIKSVKDGGAAARKTVETNWERVDKLMNLTYLFRQTGKKASKGRSPAKDRARGFETISFRSGYDTSDWYLFQKAAKEQQSMVMARLLK